MNTQPLLNSFHPSTALPSFPPNSIMVLYGNDQLAIPIEQLMCLEASGNYTFVYTIDGKRYIVSKTLKSFVASLDSTLFVRVHKTWLINTNHLQNYCEYEHLIKMQGGMEITISRRRIREMSVTLASFKRNQKVAK